jgi:hypothetical protein
MRIEELKPIFCEHIPQEKENGILYVSEKFEVCVHLCACGCGQQTVIPFSIEKSDEENWHLINNDGKISLTPSIGNFSGENPYHAHYFITENKIIWC